MTFVCNARYFLLTYSHVESLDPFALVEHFGNLGAEILVSRERYADGSSIHYHVWCDFGRKFRSRRASIFDVAGFHPNIEASRGTPETGYDYSVKDGDIVAGGAERPCGIQSGSKSANWHTIVNAATRDEFFALCEELDPMRLVTNFSQIQKFADFRYAVVPEPYVSPNGVFDIADYGDLSEWWTGVQQSEGGR